MVAYVRQGDIATLNVYSSAAVTLRVVVHVRYDDGVWDELLIPEFATNGLRTQEYTSGSNRARKNGLLVGVTCVNLSALKRGQAFVEIGIAHGPGASRYQIVAAGYVYDGHVVSLGEYVEPQDVTWVFQGTVAEDATAGTHVCTLTVTPNAGNEIEVLYGFLTGGNTATAQLYSVAFDDGTNIVGRSASAFSSTTANATFAVGTDLGTNQNLTGIFPLPKKPIVSSTMRLVLTISTAAVSVTQTFAVACRILHTSTFGALPTATLADSVGAPTLTTNTNAVF